MIKEIQGLLLLIFILYFLFGKTKIKSISAEKKISLCSGLLVLLTYEALSRFGMPLITPFLKLLQQNHFINWSKGFYLGFICFLAADFYFFICHFLQHKIDILWRFHSFHHSPEHMSYEVHYRQSLGSVLFQFIFFIFFIALLNLGIGFVGFYIGIINLYQILLHSKNLRWPKWLGYILILPQNHRLHHTKQLQNYNFGGMLSIWDRLLLRHKEGEPENETYGIPNSAEKIEMRDFFLPQKMEF